MSDLTLTHVGGVRFPITGPLRYTMTIDDALDLARLLRPSVAIPVHYEGWSHFREGRPAIVYAVARDPGDVPLALLTPGRRTAVDELRRAPRTG